MKEIMKKKGSIQTKAKKEADKKKKEEDEQKKWYNSQGFNDSFAKLGGNSTTNVDKEEPE